MFRHGSLFDASHRRPGLVAVMTLSLALLVTPAATADAAAFDCVGAATRLAEWNTEIELSGGLTSDLLAELETLTSSLEICGDAGSRPAPDVEFPAGRGYEGMGDDPEVWRPLAAVYFESDQVDRVMCLMGHESGGNPEARNTGSDAAGLMQVMPTWAPHFGYGYDDLFNPAINLWVARQILDQQGWSAWAPYQRGECR
jgi:Transglycosylase SLT domain